MTDHNGPIMVPAGMDTFKAIGRPRGGMEGSSVTLGMQEWSELFEKMFPGAACPLTPHPPMHACMHACCDSNMHAAGGRPVPFFAATCVWCGFSWWVVSL